MPFFFAQQKKYKSIYSAEKYTDVKFAEAQVCTREKVAAKRKCHARVYKGITAANVTFREREGTTACVTDFCANKNRNGEKSVPMRCRWPGPNRHGDALQMLDTASAEPHGSLIVAAVLF